MLGRDFAAWSEHILALVANDAAYRTCCEPFLKAITDNAPEAELLKAYKLSLANLILNFKPLVSPSTFLLDVKGQPAKPGTQVCATVSTEDGAGIAARCCPAGAAPHPAPSR